ncbi:hypothetical protein IWZ00DRAFT_514697 [Phyllosticta capitalensis]
MLWLRLLPPDLPAVWTGICVSRCDPGSALLSSLLVWYGPVYSPRNINQRMPIRALRVTNGYFESFKLLSHQVSHHV